MDDSKGADLRGADYERAPCNLTGARRLRQFVVQAQGSCGTSAPIAWQRTFLAKVIWREQIIPESFMKLRQWITAIVLLLLVAAAIVGMVWTRELPAPSEEAAATPATQRLGKEAGGSAPVRW